MRGLFVWLRGRCRPVAERFGGAKKATPFSISILIFKLKNHGEMEIVLGTEVAGLADQS
jgi:hypothetical protein